MSTQNHLVGHSLNSEQRHMLSEQEVRDNKRMQMQVIAMNNKYIGQEVLGLTRHIQLPSDSIMRGGLRGNGPSINTSMPTPVGFRSLSSPTFDMWSINVFWSKKVSKISKIQFQHTNEASFRGTLRYLGTF